MIRSFFNLLYGSQQVEFESSFGLSESVERLKARIYRFPFKVLFKEAALGCAEEDHVRLVKKQRFFNSIFVQRFYGAFIAREGRIFLTGRFTRPLFAKVFITFFYAQCLYGVMNFVLVLPNLGLKTAFAFLLVSLMIFCSATVFFGLESWLFRNDPVWLSKFIQKTLLPDQTQKTDAMESKRGDSGK